MAIVIGNQNHQPIEGIPAHQGISELLDSQWCYLVTSDAPIHNVPEVPNLSQVWGVDGINAFTIQKRPIHSSHMRPDMPTGLIVALRISFQYLTAVMVPLTSSWRSVWPSNGIQLQTITDPPPSLSCCMMSYVPFPDSVTSVTCAHCEPEHSVLIHEEIRVSLQTRQF